MRASNRGKDALSDMMLSRLRSNLNCESPTTTYLCPVDGCGATPNTVSGLRRHFKVHNREITKDEEVRAVERAKAQRKNGGEAHTPFATFKSRTKELFKKKRSDDASAARAKRQAKRASLNA